MVPRCRGCKYYDHHTYTCDYFLRTFERRGCPADENCTRYVPAERMIQLADYFAGIGELPEGDRKILELYEQGCSDREIGRQLGKTDKAIQYWRWKRGLPSNTWRYDDED